MVGEIGMCPDDFWHKYSLSDLNAKRYYHFKRENDRIKDKWERTRLIVYHNYMANASSKEALNMKPQDFMPFTWDKEQPMKKKKQNAKMSDDNIARLMRVANQPK